MTTPTSAKRLRVMFVHAADELYGSDVILLEIARRLRGLGVDARVELPNDLPFNGLLGDALTARGIPVRRSRLAVLRRRYFTPLALPAFAFALVRSSLRLARTIRRERVDVVHSHTSAVLSGALAAWLTGRPHLWHVSEIIERPRVVRNLLARLVPAASRRVVGVSGAVAAAMPATSPSHAARWSVIHNGFDADAFAARAGGGRTAIRAELGLSDDDVLVAMVGRVGTWKGQELLLDAFALLPPRRDVRLLLVGGPVGGDAASMDALRARAARSGGDRVTVWDYRSDVPAIVSAADVFVQPSALPDPFPTTVLEAMSLARPVIATAHGGHAEQVVDGETGLLTAPGDASAMADALRLLCEDRDRRERMGAAGARRVRECFPTAGFAERYVALYRELADAR